MRPFMQVANATDLPFEDNSFDLVIGINTIHNLPPEGCKQSLREIQRVTAKDAFITVDAWHNDSEREAMLKWNLTALSYMHVDDWIKFLYEAGYTGDYWWFIAESA